MVWRLNIPVKSSQQAQTFRPVLACMFIDSDPGEGGDRKRVANMLTWPRPYFPNIICTCTLGVFEVYGIE